MASSEDFKKLYELYQTEGVPNGVSIVDFCQRNGVVYNQFERWFKKRYTKTEAGFHKIQSLNNRHNKQTYSGNSLSQKHRSENRKKGRDEKEQDYTGPDKDNPEGGAAAADDDVTSGVDQKNFL